MAWRLAQSLVTLLAEVNSLYPDRYKGTDGGISGYTYGAGGSVVNPNNQSSHNINSAGVVCAFDITTGDYPGGISTKDGQALAEQIRIRVRDQPRGIPFYGIHYMAPPYVAIAGPKICTYGTNWEWEHYSGEDPHTSHQHWSADWDVFPGGAPSGLADYDTTLPWNLTTITGQGSDIIPIQEDDMSAEELKIIREDINSVHQSVLNGTETVKGYVATVHTTIIRDVGAQLAGIREAVSQTAAGKDIDWVAVEAAAKRGAEAAIAEGVVKVDVSIAGGDK